MQQEIREVTSYLKGILSLFQYPDAEPLSETNLLQAAAAAMQQWYHSLPQVTLIFQHMDGIPEDTIKQIKVFRKVLSCPKLEPEEFLFHQLPQIMKAGTDLSLCLRQTARIKRKMELHLQQLKQQAAERVRKIFGGNSQEDLTQCFHSWWLTLEKRRLLELSDLANVFLEYITELRTHDEEAIISKLSKLITGYFVEDWKDATLESFTSKLYWIKKEVEEQQVKNGFFKKELRITSMSGRCIRWYFTIPERNAKNHNFQATVEGVLRKEGALLQEEEQAAILIDIVEHMLEKLTFQKLNREVPEEESYDLFG